MQTNRMKHSETLAENGVVVIENYFNDQKCNQLYSEISTAIQAEDIDVVEGGYSYTELLNWDGAVADKRTGRDEGMIDVFNLDSIVPEVESFKNDDVVVDIINQAVSEDFSPDNVNAYWNRSVTETRDFHADTYSGKYKSFLYLTDVPDRSYGPFSYIKGSHTVTEIKIRASSLLNRFNGKPSTNAVFYDKNNIEYYTAPKGTLIIANQAGYHRGHPQEEGKERMLLTTSYTSTN